MKNVSIEFDYDSNIPLYRQLYEYILKEIQDGRIKENEKLPSRRSLCNQLKINKNTVESAYQKLAAEGYIMSEPRSGFYVRNRVGSVKDIDEENLPDYIYNFSINGIDVFKLPHDIWGKLYRDAISQHPNLFNHGSNFGEPILQRAISKYLNENRGIVCNYNQVVIGAGFDYLILMLSIILEKNTVYGVENPCMERLYSTLTMNDRKIHLLDVTKNEFPMEELKNSNVNVVFVMSSHQYPVGYSISLEQRQQLLEWVNAKKNRYIVEFHNDSEFVYGKQINSLKSLDKNEKVIYIGDFVKTIGPSIKTSYIVLPPHLLKKWKNRINTYYAPVNLFEQWVLAEFITEGHFERHIKQMKIVYSKKRDLLISELKKAPFWDKMELFENKNGMHFIVKFNTDIPEIQMEKAAREEGVKIIPLSRHFFRRTGLFDHKYFVFGFGGLENFEIVEAVKLLIKAWGTL